MKKVASILAFVFAFTIAAQAQKGAHRMRKMNKKDKLTVEQKATISVKRLALTLDLNNSQINKIKPLLTAQISKREAFFKKMKAAKTSGKKRVVKKDFERINKELDEKLDFQNKMKRILTEKQYEKFKKIKHHARKKGKMKMIKKRKINKRLKKKRQ